MGVLNTMEASPKGSSFSAGRIPVIAASDGDSLPQLSIIVCIFDSGYI